MSELTTNKAVEAAAIEHVLARERTAGRAAVDTRGTGSPVDIEGDHLIEVKAFGGSARGNDLWLETKQVEAARAEPDRFHLVIVDNVRQGQASHFRVLDIHGGVLRTMLERARPRSHVEVPFSTKLYDELSSIDET